MTPAGADPANETETVIDAPVVTGAVQTIQAPWSAVETGFNWECRTVQLRLPPEIVAVLKLARLAVSACATTITRELLGGVKLELAVPGARSVFPLLYAEARTIAINQRLH